MIQVRGRAAPHSWPAGIADIDQKRTGHSGPAGVEDMCMIWYDLYMHSRIQNPTRLTGIIYIYHAIGFTTSPLQHVLYARPGLFVSLKEDNATHRIVGCVVMHESYGLVLGLDLHGHWRDRARCRCRWAWYIHPPIHLLQMYEIRGQRGERASGKQTGDACMHVCVCMYIVRGWLPSAELDFNQPSCPRSWMAWHDVYTILYTLYIMICIIILSSSAAATLCEPADLLAN